MTKKLNDNIKIYNFVYKGTEYNISNHANNQCECPHCGNSRDWLSCLDPVKNSDLVSFIGLYNREAVHAMLCLECKKCHEKFWYHVSRFTKYRILKYLDKGLIEEK